MGFKFTPISNARKQEHFPSALACYLTLHGHRMRITTNHLKYAPKGRILWAVCGWAQDINTLQVFREKSSFSAARQDLPCPAAPEGFPLDPPTSRSCQGSVSPLQPGKGQQDAQDVPASSHSPSTAQQQGAQSWSSTLSSDRVLQVLPAQGEQKRKFPSFPSERRDLNFLSWYRGDRLSGFLGVE